MLVCHCNVVNDRVVRAAVASGAQSVAEVTASCGAGGDCAGCHPAIEDLLEDAAVAVRSPALLADRQRARRRSAPAPLSATA